MLTLEEVKNNLRLDYDADDVYIQTLIDTSSMFILGAIEVKTVPMMYALRLASSCWFLFGMKTAFQQPAHCNKMYRSLFRHLFGN